MNEQEKKRQRIYDLLNAKTILTFLCRPYTKQRKILTEKVFFLTKRDGWRIEQKIEKKALASEIKKGPTMSIRKHAYELEVHEKTVRTAIKQDLSSDLKPLDYTIWGVLENKAIATTHPNIGPLKRREMT